MTTIKIYDGTTFIGIEVEDKFALEFQEMEHKDALIERKETRRHQSLNRSIDNGFDFKDERVDIERDAEVNEQKQILQRAVEQLEPQQQWLVKQIYFEERTQIDVANELGVGESAIRSRLKKIFEKMKKYLD